ncbi:Pterin 4 alpha carbinolamine dehydratase [Sesbania bispinosa]|nr:Pterin 4 alpha carbinolamine dehydratase [Sesbania bispinosa]
MTCSVLKKMNRVLAVGHPLLVRSASNSKLSLSVSPSIFQFQAYSSTRGRMNSEIHKIQVGVQSLPTFTTFCATYKGASDLSTKKCVPCNTKDLQPMTLDAANTLIPQVSQWNLVNEGGILKLRRSWKVKNFNKGLEFFRLIADLAEAEGHHPDLHLVGWNNVTIEIWTHSVGGLTENDFILAAKINELNLLDLLRRKASD